MEEGSEETEVEAEWPLSCQMLTEDPLADETALGIAGDEDCDPLALPETCSESGESIIEVEEEKCCLCGAKFFSRLELTHHLALQHFQHGLLQELLARGWEDGDLRCPQCGDLGGGGGVLLHWATQHNRVEALLRRCYDGGRCNLYRDKLLCNDYLKRRSKLRVQVNSKLAGAFHQAEEEEEDNVIVLDGSDSSADEIEVLEEIEQSKPGNRKQRKGISLSKPSPETKKATKTAAVNNNVSLPTDPGHSIKTEATSDLSNSNNNDDAQTGDEEIIVETILEKISSSSSEESEVAGKPLKTPKAYQDQIKSTSGFITEARQLSKAASPGEVETRGTATVCKICSKSFPSRREFQDHLAAQHFRLELEREILKAGPGPFSCPSCSHFKSKDLTGLVVHYGARCKPFPVNKLYTNWLSQSALGFSTDICFFCGAKAHSPNDLVFHLIDKHVGEVLQKMGFTFFFKFQKVGREQGEVVEFSCPSCPRTEGDLSKLCLHFMRQHETFFIEVYQRFSRLVCGEVECVVCGAVCSSPDHQLHHLLSHHYSQALLSECGCSPDLMLACNSCPFVHRDTEAMVSHYAQDHHRVEFFFTESLTNLVQQGGIEVSHFNLETESIAPDDFERLYSLLQTTKALEEVSVRRVLLNPSGQFYKAMLELVAPPVSGAGAVPVFQCPICNLKLFDERLMVSHLALRPHWRAGVQLKILAGKKLRDLRCKLCHEQLRSQKEFWRHQVRQHFYDDLAVQILEKNAGRSGKLSCPVSSCQFEHESLSRVVDHLGLDHEEAAEKYKRFLVSSQILTCQLCKKGTSSLAELKLHLATDHFSRQLLSVGDPHAASPRCLLCGAETEDMLTHLGLVHNLTEELYRREISREFQCSLCPGWRSCEKAEFLDHITSQHCRRLLTERTWVRDLTGAPVFRCDLCSQYLASESLYLSHVGREGPCHQSLPLYFDAVDRRGGFNNPLLSGAQALARLGRTKSALPAEGKFFRSFISQLLPNSGDYVDPFSCDINFKFNFNTISIILHQPIHPDCLKPIQRFKKGPFSCNFCDILEQDFVETDFVSYQIHLAEHYSEQLESYFAGEGSEQYTCYLCPTEEVFTNLQCLVGHLATQHDFILGLYEATALPNAQLICDKTPVDLPPDHFLLSSIFPWFPRGWPAIRNVVSDSVESEISANTEQTCAEDNCSQFQCLECLVEFSGVSELMNHMAEMEHINLHWVAETNRDGRWYEKKVGLMRCTICISEGRVVPQFNSGKAVILHSLRTHREKFQSEYLKTTNHFVICKICKFYIGFNSATSQSERRRSELSHYVSHGPAIFSSLGLVSPSVGSVAPCLDCSLCGQTLPSHSALSKHLASIHSEELLRRSRQFDSGQLVKAGPPDGCCICESGNNSSHHLAQHDKSLLASLGFIQPSNDPTKHLCRVCHSVSKDISTIIHHFQEEHSSLYNFITSKYRELSQSKPPPEELCLLCGVRLPSREFDSHLYMTHYQSRVRARLEVYPLRCPYCVSQREVLVPGLQHLIQHCIDKHQMVRKFYQEDLNRPDRSQPVEKRATQTGSFESAFMKFVGSESEETPAESTPTLTEQNQVHVPAKEEEDESKPPPTNDQCKICGKEFEEKTVKGEVKSKGRLAADIRTHYTSHFRDKLISMYPSSFSGSSPLTCEKCGFESKSKNSLSIKQIMLAHIASCQGELDQLIANCERRANPAPSQNSKLKSQQKSRRRKISGGWKVSSSCLVCGVELKDNIRNMHYVNHFKSELKQISSPQINNLRICPFENCQFANHRKFPDNEIIFEMNLFVHLGCDHDLFSKLILKRKQDLSTNGFVSDAENNDPSTANLNFSKDYKNCLQTLNERLWAIRASDCFVCGARIQDLPRSSRLGHYQSHFTSLDQILASLGCGFCGARTESRRELLLHILHHHLPGRIDQHWRTAVDGSLRCLYCPFQVGGEGKKQMVLHLTDEEMLLEVEILRQSLPTPRPRKPIKQRERQKGSNKTLSTFIRELEANPLCVKCNIAGESLNSLMNHLVRNHYTDQITPNLLENFPDLLVLEKHQGTARCKLCGKALSARRSDVAHHWGVDHRKILQLYYEDINSESNKDQTLPELSDEDEEIEYGNKLNALFEDLESDSEETVENRERENLLRIHRFLDKARSSKKVFVQVGPCYLMEPGPPPCHECKKIQAGAARVSSGSCCCFEGFRKLKFNNNTKIGVCGFLDPVNDPKSCDIDVWSPTSVRGDMSEELAVFVLKWVGDLLCNLLHEEKLVKQNYSRSGREIIWRRAHQSVREMCDVCSTTLFNLHFTCPSCSIMVCPDCFTARERGTKYRSLTNMSRPYRTRKRVARADMELDNTLWPLCTSGDIHSLQDLLLTQMSPASLPELTVKNLHQMRKYFNLPAHCNCCQSPENSSVTDEDQLRSEFEVESLGSCLFCPLSFRELSAECKKLHLGFHLQQKILSGSGSRQCSDCGLQLADDGGLLKHKVLFHAAVEKYLNGEFVKAEEDLQWSCKLEIDENLVCEICGCNLNTDKRGRRNHYFSHLDKLLQSDLPLCPPFRCGDCGKTELTRSRLARHQAVAHRKLDLCLEKYLSQQEEPGQSRAGSDWASLGFCLRCQENFDGQSLSVRRLHYVRHFRQQLESWINSQHDQLLLRDPPFRCREPSCSFETGEKIIFINHIGGKHKHVDSFILAELGPSVEMEEPESHYTKCSVCQVKFEAEEKKQAIDLHYFDHLQDRMRDVLTIPMFKLPLCCPFPKCSFKTEDVKSTEKLHHEKHLLYHIGSHHQVMQKFAKGNTEEISLFKHSEKYLDDSQCKICEKDFSKMTKMKVRNHYFKHVRRIILTDYCGDSPDQCPLCGHQVGRDREVLSLHLASHHGLIDHYVEVLSTTLDYSVPGCLLPQCPHQFLQADRISETNLHYTSHFLSELSQENHLEPGTDGTVTCWLCGDIFPSLQLSVMHIGSQHGGFHKQIQKIICNQDQLDLGFSEPIWYSVSDNCLSSQCGICGEKLVTMKTSSEEEIKSLLRRHLDDCHIGQTNFMAENQITKTLIGLYQSGTQFFLPSKTEYDDFWLGKNSVKANKSILNGFVEHKEHTRKEMSTKSTEKRKFEPGDFQQFKKIKTGESPNQGGLAARAETCHNSLSSFIESLSAEDSDVSDGEEEESDPSMLSLIQSFLEVDEKLGIRHDSEPPRQYQEAGLGVLSPRHVLTKQESEEISPASHSWLCDGSLLQLEDAISPHNMKLFQCQWARGQPVLISNSQEYLNLNLWHPRAFKKDFGHLKADLVNTLTGKTVPNQPLKWFWEGFENVSCRLQDSSGRPMLLKLKDWPAEDDIAKFIPKRYHDLVHDFPIQPYTLREGNCNLASYIPDCYLRPELGPKMYIAYGNALYSSKASTNLHLDMSDAVNLLVYVGIPSDTSQEENIRLVLQQIDEAGCDLSMKNRVRKEGKLPGALWHIYHPGDTNKIRDLLTKVAIENRRRLDPHDDPIHDQSTYLDTGLRKRLYAEYGVKGYPVIQCSGDTVFIPAGACHQVRNLHNCIKIAEDFVSPELTHNSLHLTQEFRHLTEHHTNHEDKLQIKNIIYHSVKTAVAKLNKVMEQNQSKENNEKMKYS